MKRIIQYIFGIFIQRPVRGRGDSPLENKLITLNSGTHTEKELYFNGETGELELAEKNRKFSADSQTLDQIAEDGFLA